MIWNTGTVAGQIKLQSLPTKWTKKKLFITKFTRPPARAAQQPTAFSPRPYPIPARRSAAGEQDNRGQPRNARGRPCPQPTRKVRSPQQRAAEALGVPRAAPPLPHALQVIPLSSLLEY